MYAVVQLGANQYKVSEGDTVEAGRLSEEKGKSVTLEKVLMLVDGEDIRIGQPFLKNVKVTADIVDHTIGEKVFAFKFRRRKDSSTKRGHRKKLTVLNIKKISVSK